MEQGIKKYEELRFADAFMFCKVMTNYPDICKEVVELCIGQKVCNICYKEGEKTIGLSPEYKGIRLDVYLEDVYHTIYDLEMQTVPKTDLGKRIRYYDSIMSLNSLASGKAYKELPNSYIVFICLFDPFKENRVIYEFKRRETEDPKLLLGDGTTDILINVYGDACNYPDEMREFLDAVKGQVTGDGISKKIDNAVREVRSHKKWRTEYMLYELLIQESKEEGRRQTLLENIRSLMAKYDLTADAAMDVLEVSEEERQDLKDSLS